MAKADEPALEVRLFGHLEVTVKGQLLASDNWPRQKTQDLFKILISKPGKIFTRDQLIELLFPDHDPDAATKNLYNRFSELRHILEPDLEPGGQSRFILHTKPSNYLFNHESAYKLDIEQFAEALDHADRHRETGDWSEALKLYGSAMELYRDEFLADDQYEDWTIHLRQRLRERYLEGLEAMADCHAQLGSFDEAICLCDTIIDETVYPEHIFRNKMLYLYLKGERSEALRIYHECVQILKDELDAGPTTLTIELERQIREDKRSELQASYPQIKLPQAITAPGRLKRATIVGLAIAVILIVSIGLTINYNLFFSENPTALNASIRSLAILPFLDLSPDEDNEYFADGMAEELISSMSQIKELRVVARTSTFLYKGHELDIRQIGEHLDADAVIEGSVRKAGSQLRVTVQLIDTASQAHLWANNYDVEYDLENIIAIQTDIADQVTRALDLRLTEEAKRKIERLPTTSSEAYFAYQRGLFFLQKHTADGFQRAKGYLDQAVQLDPQFAEAYAALAEVHVWLSKNGFIFPTEGYQEARKYANQSLGIDAKLAEAFLSMGNIHMDFDWNWHDAEENFKKAIELNSGLASAHDRYATLLQFQGRFDEAIQHMQRARKLDPMNVFIQRNYGELLIFARRYDEAISELQIAIDMEPDRLLSHLELGLAHLAKGEYLRSIDLFKVEKDLAASQESVWELFADMYLAVAHGLNGNSEITRAMLDQLMSVPEKTGLEMAIAMMHITLREFDQALDWLEAAYKERSPWMQYLRVHFLLDELQDEPRFVALLEKMDLAH